MTIDFPDGVALRLHERWHNKLTEAQDRYTADRNEANRSKYLKVLRIFAALVVRDEVPDEGADESQHSPRPA
jgi:hypothetical protein